MNGYEYDTEADEAFEDAGEYDEASDEASDEARRGPLRFRPIRPGPVATGKNLVRPRPTPGRYVTEARFQAGLARVGADIRKNSEAIKKVAVQASRVNSQLVSTTSRLDKEIKDTKKELKKQAETTLLLTLLQSGPTITPQSTTVTTPTGTTTALTSVTVTQPSNLLPLILLGGSGGLGGGLGGDGDTSNLLLIALALGGKL